ncbi:MAG: hypothetical protein AAB949_01210 [Patescibacteria group bacterium]
MSWLKMLAMELSSIDTKEYYEPEDEVDSKFDAVAGEASDEIKRIYMLAEKLREAGARYIVDARFSRDNQLRTDAQKKAYELKQKTEVLMQIIWITLKDDFDLWDKYSIGIRKGWKVVYRREDAPPPTFLDLLGNL